MGSSSIVAITGDARGKRVELLKKHRIGRMFIQKTIRPYEGENWGFDNGAFKDFLSGKEFDRNRYLKSLERATRIADDYHPPYLAVIPDIVAAGMKSLEFSISWLEGELRHINFNWYLAVQDGMEPAEVEKILKTYPQIKGLFLGGTDQFKKTAPFWSSLAHRHGKLFHYARAGSMKKVNFAKKSLADSLDSALPLWSEEKLDRFIRALRRPAQLELFNSV